MNIKINKLLYLAIPIFLIFIFTQTTYASPSDNSVINSIKNVFVTNFPDIFNTREQNLDDDGNIKVHEQGTVDVNIVNQSSSGEYEYKYFCLGDRSQANVNLRLNENAQEGWELVDAEEGRNVDFICLYFRRPTNQ